MENTEPQREKKISKPTNMAQFGCYLNLFSSIDEFSVDDTAQNVEPSIISWNSCIEIIYMATFHLLRNDKEKDKITLKLVACVDCHISGRFNFNVAKLLLIIQRKRKTIATFSFNNREIVIKSELPARIFVHVITNLW